MRALVRSDKSRFVCALSLFLNFGCATEWRPFAAHGSLDACVPALERPIHYADALAIYLNGSYT